MHQPLITVVTCTLNRARFIKKCLKSIETQTYTNFEHIIVDGLSSDGTMAILENYQKRNPTRTIKLLQAPPKGISNAMNIGIDNAKGEIIHFLHDDDYYLTPDVLTKVAQLFAANPDKLWLTGNCYLEYKGKSIKIPFRKLALMNISSIPRIPSCISHENTFVKKDLFTKYGKFDETLKYHMDYDLWSRLTDKKEKPLFVDDYFTAFIVHEDSMSSSYKNQIQSIKEFMKMFERRNFSGIKNKLATSVTKRL